MGAKETPAKIMSQETVFRNANIEDINGLLELENKSFSADRLSRRSFRHWIQAAHGTLLVCEFQNEIVAYGLLWCHKGTRLARLYSLAVASHMRGKGVADELLKLLEMVAMEKRRLYMRLEVSKNNHGAIKLYQRHGYQVFGEYCDYYQDHSDALRMQKRIMRITQDQLLRTTPWYRQTTEFTCGPASLMMAMASLCPTMELNQGMELDIWREATTIFMTSGLGGCHPLGLAIAAQRRQCQAQVFINSNKPLFLDGVRSDKKREILKLVHNQFVDAAEAKDIKVHYKEILQNDLQSWLEGGYAVIILISTYRLDGKKAPHWVCVTAIDDKCIYVHDSDPEEKNQIPFDCQYLPIAREDFEKMSTFGSSRLRTAIILKAAS